MGSVTLSERVAAEVRAEMARQRKTGTRLASVLQCSQQSASRRVLGTQSFALDELPTVAGWLGVSVASLLASGMRTADSAIEVASA